MKTDEKLKFYDINNLKISDIDFSDKFYLYSKEDSLCVEVRVHFGFILRNRIFIERNQYPKFSETDECECVASILYNRVTNHDTLIKILKEIEEHVGNELFFVTKRFKKIISLRQVELRINK